MNKEAQRKARQDLVVATIGGTLLAGNHRISDNLVAAVDAIRAIADLGPRDRNLSSTARTMLAGLAEDYPGAVTAEGVTDVVAAEAAALVEDTDVLVDAGAADAVEAATDALSDLCGSSHCDLDASDGLAVYPYVAEDEDEGCEGHESLAGEHMGEAVYCDGSCR